MRARLRIFPSMKGKHALSAPLCTPLRSFRLLVYDGLVAIHQNGILHGDVREANVLLGYRGPVIIDFSHSSFDHTCPKEMPCKELEIVRSMLHLDDAYLERKSTRAHILFLRCLRFLPPQLFTMHFLGTVTALMLSIGAWFLIVSQVFFSIRTTDLTISIVDSARAGWTLVYGS